MTLLWNPDFSRFQFFGSETDPDWQGIEFWVKNWYHTKKLTNVKSNCWFSKIVNFEEIPRGHQIQKAKFFIGITLWRKLVFMQAKQSAPKVLALVPLIDEFWRMKMKFLSDFQMRHFLVIFNHSDHNRYCLAATLKLLSKNR